MNALLVKYLVNIILTCFVGCKLQMTSFPPCLRFLRGKFPLGTICKVVPNVIFKSAILIMKEISLREYLTRLIKIYVLRGIHKSHI